jgi:hypothetical protein
MRQNDERPDREEPEPKEEHIGVTFRLPGLVTAVSSSNRGGHTLTSDCVVQE